MSRVLYRNENGASGTASPRRVSSKPAFDKYYAVNIDVETRLKTQYQLAIRQYLNRDFSRAWEIVGPLIRQITEEVQADSSSDLDPEIIVKCYKLYLSLVDLVLKDLNYERPEEKPQEEHIVNFPEYLPGGKLEAQGDEIYRRFMDGVLVRQVRTIYGHNLGQCDADLLLMCFIIEYSNGFKLQRLREQLEAYLTYVGLLAGSVSPAALNDPKKVNVLVFYLMQVMVRMGRAEESRDLICRIFVADDELVDSYLAKLDAQEKKMIEEAEKKKKPFPRSPRKHRQRRSQSKVAKAAKLEPKTKAEEKEKPLPPIEVHHPTTSQSSILSNLHSYVTSLWYGKTLSSLLRPAMVIVFVLSLLVSLGAFRRQQRLKRYLTWLLRRLKETLSMALKVSYM